MQVGSDLDQMVRADGESSTALVPAVQCMRAYNGTGTRYNVECKIKYVINAATTRAGFRELKMHNF